MSLEAKHDHPWDQRRRGFEPIVVVGLLITVLLHGGVVGSMLWLRRAEAAQPPPPPRKYVVAKLVRLGKKRDPKKLPNKIVPQVSTRKINKVSYDARADDTPVRRKRKRPDRDAKIADKLRSSLDKAAQLAKLRDMEQEGDPNGVAGGTASEASEGDVYMTRIADIWNRTWSLPAVIDRADAKKLFVLVVIKIDRKGKVASVHFDRKSGNDVFDGSIKAAWARIKRLPVPPPDRIDRIVAHGLKLKLTWRGLR